MTVFQKSEGSDMSMVWYFSSSESRKFFCKRECKDGDVLIDTNENRAQRGRYSIEYKNTEPAGGFLSVNIANLVQSDSGRYRFGVGRPLFPDSFGEFEVRVLSGEFLMI